MTGRVKNNQAYLLHRPSKRLRKYLYLPVHIRQVKTLPIPLLYQPRSIAKQPRLASSGELPNLVTLVYLGNI